MNVARDSRPTKRLELENWRRDWCPQKEEFGRQTRYPGVNCARCHSVVDGLDAGRLSRLGASDDPRQSHWSRPGNYQFVCGVGRRSGPHGHGAECRRRLAYPQRGVVRRRRSVPGKEARNAFIVDPVRVATWGKRDMGVSLYSRPIRGEYLPPRFRSVLPQSRARGPGLGNALAGVRCCRSAADSPIPADGVLSHAPGSRRCGTACTDGVCGCAPVAGADP
jgi:hypothetical protein